MIYIKKSDDVSLQKLLDAAKTKNDETAYRSGTVYEQLKKDFYEKCYLCEDNEITTINIEHFEPHEGDLYKKFEWKNLFYSCGHCNNIKSNKFFPLLDCTNESDKVWESIEIRLNAFPKVTVDIVIHDGYSDTLKLNNTKILLEKILSGKDTTLMKRDEAATLRKKMLRVYNDIQIKIDKNDSSGIIEATKDSAQFSGMVRWILKHSVQKNG